MAKANGKIIYRGPSLIDGSPIVAVAVGLNQSSTNTKTGAMLQTYILSDVMAPIEAVKTGNDASICGDCPHRGDGFGNERTCYVTLMHGPSAVYRKLKSANPYPMADNIAELGAGRMVRLGTYGDPGAVPLDVWLELVSEADGRTGYTHRWLALGGRWRELLMASADTVADSRHAQTLGWRTFRVGESKQKGETLCPASEQAGKKLQCIDCRACEGATGRRGSIYIPAHGSGASDKNMAALNSRLIPLVAA